MFFLQICVNFSLFISSLLGIVLNKKNILITLMCIELLLLSINMNFVLFSVYLDDIYGQIFSLFVLTIAASESAIGLAIIIQYFRIRNNINNLQTIILRY